MKLEAAALVAGALGIYFTTKKTPIIKDSKNTAVAKGVGVNAAFLKQIKFLLRICIPSIFSETAGILALHTMFLILRTYISVFVARLDGRIVKDMVRGEWKSFFRSITIFMLISIPATYTNSMIKYLQSKLALALRTTLTLHAHDIYMSQNTFYKAINLDKRIDGADQLIATDVNRFCNALASLYSNLGKPVLDIAIFNYQLAKSIGFYGFTGLTLNYFFTLFLIRSATPPFGKMAVEEANLEGGFRSAHSRLITNAEEIGFYNGEELEKHILDRNYSRLVKHLNDVLRIRISYNMFEDFLIKYSWSAVGLLLSSIPVFYPDVAGSRIKQMMSEEVPLIEAEDSPTVTRGKAGSHTQHFITNKRLMNNLADAGGRVMYSYKELSELAGFTHRVYSMFEVFEDLRNNRYLDTSSSSQKYTIGSQNGEYQVTETAISFLHTPIVTPFGDTILIEDLSFQISCGDHLMVTGPNGSGKSSILRVLAGIWPHFSGTIARPPHDLSAIMYIPQRPYLVMGSLRDQVIYPDTHDQMKAKNVTDDDLQVILKTVYLDYITLREGGWESVKEWKDVFSGGEKQRVQLARLFYHKPKFAVLDEATSAVSNDVEALLYSAAKEAGITLITISHRPSLFKYHTYLLRVGDGMGDNKWNFSQIGSSESLVASAEQEIRQINKKLGEMEGLAKRLAIINAELSLTESKDQKGAKRTLV